MEQYARRPWEWAVPLVKGLAIVVLVAGMAFAAWATTEAADSVRGPGPAFVFFGIAFRTVLGFALLAILALIAETLLESRDSSRRQERFLQELRDQGRPASRRSST